MRPKSIFVTFRPATCGFSSFSSRLPVTNSHLYAVSLCIQTWETEIHWNESMRATLYFEKTSHCLFQSSRESWSHSAFRVQVLLRLQDWSQPEGWGLNRSLQLRLSHIYHSTIFAKFQLLISRLGWFGAFVVFEVWSKLIYGCTEDTVYSASHLMHVTGWIWHDHVNLCKF